MPRTSIRQFRAALTGAADQGRAMRAYREITRRPRAVAGPRMGDWIPWGAAARGDLVGWPEWPAAAAPAARQPGARFAAWGDWSGPPGRTASA